MVKLKINQPKIIFIHIPKTGGQTLINILDSGFGRDKVLRIWGEKSNLETGRYCVQDFFNLEPTFLDSFQCFGGHIHLNQIISKLGEKKVKNSYTCSILRDPIDLIISLFNYYKSNESHPQHHKIQALTFEEFLDNRYTKNIQCKFLGAKTTLEALYNCKTFVNKLVTIHNFANLVGEIANLYQLKKIKYPVKNVSQKFITRDNLSSEILAKILKDNYQDYLLFEVVKTSENLSANNSTKSST